MFDIFLQILMFDISVVLHKSAKYSTRKNLIMRTNHQLNTAILVSCQVQETMRIRELRGPGLSNVLFKGPKAI